MQIVRPVLELLLGHTFHLVPRRPIGDDVRHVAVGPLEAGGASRLASLVAGLKDSGRGRSIFHGRDASLRLRPFRPGDAGRARAGDGRTDSDRAALKWMHAGANDDTVAQTIESLQAQLGTVERVEKVIGQADSQLRLLNARLDEAAARTIELSVQAQEVAELGGLGDDVDQMVGEMESLRQAIEETSGSTPAAEPG